MTRTSSLISRAAATFVLLAGFTGLAAADCECGYSADINGTNYFFTDLIESDFAHLSNITKNKDWVRQQFNVTAASNRGSFGEVFAVDNIYTNPSSNASVQNGLASDGRPAGLVLAVKSSRVDDMVPVAEIDSNRTDIIYGTFRAGIRVTDVPGTCSAFFWYFNDTQEIDMEFLSQEFNTTNSSYPVNLVLQSREAAENGYDASRTSTFIKTYLPFNPTTDFHEYRMDFLPGRVVFYADNAVLANMEGDAVPDHAGHLVLQHWSNGNPNWSGGPPTEDATTTVSYVKAYFNSTTTQRQNDWLNRCPNINAAKGICAIPEVSATNNSASGWFFTSQHNMTNNQTVSGQGENAGTRHAPGTLLWSVLATAFIISGWGLEIW